MSYLFGTKTLSWLCWCCISSSAARWSPSSPGYIDQFVNGAMSTGGSEISIAALLIGPDFGWFIKQKLSRFWSCLLSIRPALLWSLHHISSLTLKSPIIIELGSLVSRVVISSYPSILYIICSNSGLLLSEIRIDRVSVPSSKCSCSASSYGIVCFIIVTIPCLSPLFYGRCGIRVSSNLEDYPVCVCILCLESSRCQGHLVRWSSWWQRSL